MVQKVAVKRQFMARLRHTTTGKLSSKWVPFSNQGRLAAKGEGWAPPFISCAQDTVKLWETFTFTVLPFLSENHTCSLRQCWLLQTNDGLDNATWVKLS